MTAPQTQVPGNRRRRPLPLRWPFVQEESRDAAPHPPPRSRLLQVAGEQAGGDVDGWNIRAELRAGGDGVCAGLPGTQVHGAVG